MTQGFLVVAVLLLGIGAAQARPDVRRMACADANALIRKEGAVVMTTGPNTFQRFAASARLCRRGERLRTVVLATADKPRCQIRGVCEPSPFSDLPGFGD